MIDLEAVKTLMSRVLDYVWHDFPPDGEEGFGKTSAKQIINQLVAEVERKNEVIKSLSAGFNQQNDELETQLAEANNLAANLKMDKEEMLKEIESWEFRYSIAEGLVERYLKDIERLTEQHAKPVDCLKKIGYESDPYEHQDRLISYYVELAALLLKELGVKE